MSNYKSLHLSNELAQHLLEAEGDEVNVRDFIFGRTPEQLAAADKKTTAEVRKREFFADHDKKYSAQRALGEVTPDTDAHAFYHKFIKNADRRTATRCRRNGATKRWATRPDEFRIPVKHGMYSHFYIDNRNAHEWTTVEPAPLPKPVKPRGTE